MILLFFYPPNQCSRKGGLPVPSFAVNCDVLHSINMSNEQNGTLAGIFISTQTLCKFNIKIERKREREWVRRTDVMINLYLYHRLFQIFWCCLLLSHIFHLIDWHKFSDALVGKERLPFVFAILLLPMCIDGEKL